MPSASNPSILVKALDGRYGEACRVWMQILMLMFLMTVFLGVCAAIMILLQPEFWQLVVFEPLSRFLNSSTVSL